MPSLASADVSTLPAAVKRAAAEWLVELQSDDASEQTRQAWQSWRQARPEHELAWQRIEAFGTRLNVLQPSLAHAALTPSRSPARRRAVKSLAVALFAGTAAVAGERLLPWREWRAEQQTRVGQIRALTLDDGSLLTLNSDSAINIDFTRSERRIHLVSGEIMITTGKDAGFHGRAARPFLVETTQGRLQALGTRFTVRTIDDARSSVAVYEGAVDVRPRRADARIVRAGESVVFSSQELGSTAAASEDATAWLQGMLVAEDMPLEEFVAVLARHRRGWLNCDPAVAALKVTGTYPLADTDQVLEMLTRMFPLEIAYVTRYWVTVQPRRSDT